MSTAPPPRAGGSNTVSCRPRRAPPGQRARQAAVIAPMRSPFSVAKRISLPCAVTPR
jgi:hypothetical protein